MGRRGPLPEDTTAAGDGTALTPPDHLSDVAKAHVTAVANDLAERGVLRWGDATMIEAYATIAARLEQARDAWEADGRPLTMTGSGGQAIEHVLIGVIRRLERDLERFAHSLTFTPNMRSRTETKPVDVFDAFPELRPDWNGVD
jgi:phage terminase small subunit